MFFLIKSIHIYCIYFYDILSIHNDFNDKYYKKKIIPRYLGKSSKLFISCFLATKKGLGITMPNVKIKKVSEEEKEQ